MTAYTYKGFEVVYEIEKASQDGSLYKADAHVVPKNECNKLEVSTRFHTEYPTRNGVQKEIKKLIENYIDFEWKKLSEMKEAENSI